MLIIGFSDNIYTQDKAHRKPELCQGQYHSEEAAKHQLARHLGLSIEKVTDPVRFCSIDESGVVVERKEIMRVFDQKHPKPPHAIKGDDVISAALKRTSSKANRLIFINLLEFTL